MKTLSALVTGIVFSGVAAIAQAGDNPLSVHVLNIQSGLPSPGVEVELERRTDAGWESLTRPQRMRQAVFLPFIRPMKISCRVSTA